MGFKGATVDRLQGGLGRTNPTNDGICLLIIGGAVAATGLALKTAKEFLTVENAESVGITASYDDTNDILAHHHIDEFFRLSPNGNLFVVLDDDTMTDTELKDILKANSEIKMVGFVRNAAAALADFSAYVAGKQQVVNDLRTENRNVSSVLVEGNVFASATLVAAYDDNREEEVENVSVVIAQDPIIAALKAAYVNYAAIGTALGALSVRGVHENMGSVDIENKPSAFKGNRDYPLTDTARSRWLSANLQNGNPFSGLSATEIQALNDKGYIFAGNYNGYAGIFFSDSHTATESASDYSRIENNRTWDKGADLLRTALLPRVKGNLGTDPDTGTISAVEAGELERIGLDALNTMIAAGEISGADVYIDPSQTLADDTPLQIKGQLVKNNIIHEITVELGLTKKLS
ncbi:DUF2586 family protein [Flagellimonas eckloniae]|uniref:DUF3383 domain-containing protein n=1 Tax=Flagellimonas eckloniae TaxID=346185 RepID=A0A0N8WG08_9FLAO|nr:DUF2586 family protein [Allomuricauda eckloniae]KQC30179.1 hypothetical protein AAY42_10045 [Allomuricauda eckloniae]